MSTALLHFGFERVCDVLAADNSHRRDCEDAYEIEDCQQRLN